MKFSIIALFLVTATLSQAQSKSYGALKDRFINSPEVHSFSLNGLLCRVALSVVMPEDDRFGKAMSEVRQVRMMTIPRTQFEDQGVTVNGFRGYLQKDDFGILADIKDGRERVTFYHRTESNNKNRYFVLIEGLDEVVAIEMKGYIDPEIFRNEDNLMSLSKN